MADPAKLARVAAKRSGSGDLASKPNPLDDPEQQRAILKPEPLRATIGGAEVAIHPLAFGDFQAYRALITLVFAEAATRKGLHFERLAGTLGLNRELRASFIEFVGRATFPPNATDEQLANLPKIIDEINRKTTFPELAALILVMEQRNLPVEVAADPK